MNLDILRTCSIEAMYLVVIVLHNTYMPNSEMRTHSLHYLHKGVAGISRPSEESEGPICHKLEPGNMNLSPSPDLHGVVTVPLSSPRWLAAPRADLISSGHRQRAVPERCSSEPWQGRQEGQLCFQKGRKETWVWTADAPQALRDRAPAPSPAPSPCTNVIRVLQRRPNQVSVGKQSPGDQTLQGAGAGLESGF